MGKEKKKAAKENLKLPLACLNIGKLLSYLGLSSLA
jgi:hypothetical protein